NITHKHSKQPIKHSPYHSAFNPPNADPLKNLKSSPNPKISRRKHRRKLTQELSPRSAKSTPSPTPDPYLSSNKNHSTYLNEEVTAGHMYQNSFEQSKGHRDPCIAVRKDNAKRFSFTKAQLGDDIFSPSSPHMNPTEQSLETYKQSATNSWLNDPVHHHLRANGSQITIHLHNTTQRESDVTVDINIGEGHKSAQAQSHVESSPVERDSRVNENHNSAQDRSSVNLNHHSDNNAIETVVQDMYPRQSSGVRISKFSSSKVSNRSPSPLRSDDLRGRSRPTSAQPSELSKQSTPQQNESKGVVIKRAGVKKDTENKDSIAPSLSNRPKSYHGAESDSKSSSTGYLRRTKNVDTYDFPEKPKQFEYGKREKPQDNIQSRISKLMGSTNKEKSTKDDSNISMPSSVRSSRSNLDNSSFWDGFDLGATSPGESSMGSMSAINDLVRDPKLREELQRPEVLELLRKYDPMGSESSSLNSESSYVQIYEETKSKKQRDKYREKVETLYKSRVENDRKSPDSPYHSFDNERSGDVIPTYVPGVNKDVWDEVDHERQVSNDFAQPDESTDAIPDSYADIPPQSESTPNKKKKKVRVRRHDSLIKSASEPDIPRKLLNNKRGILKNPLSTEDIISNLKSPCPSECSERPARIDHNTYQSYAAGILHSSQKGKKFMRLQQNYAILEYVANLETCILESKEPRPVGSERLTEMHVKSKIGRMGQRDDLDGNGKISQEKLKQFKELQLLYKILDEAQEKDEFYYDNDNIAQFQWNPYKDYSIKYREKSLDDIYGIFEYNDPNLNYKRGKSRPKSNGSDFRRELSFRKVLEKYKNLDAESRENMTFDDFFQSQRSRRNSDASSIYSTASTVPGSYLQMQENASRRSNDIVLYGTNIDEDSNKYEQYVESLKNRSKSLPNLHRRSSEQSVEELKIDEPRSRSVNRFNDERRQSEPLSKKNQQYEMIKVSQGNQSMTYPDEEKKIDIQDRRSRFEKHAAPQVETQVRNKEKYASNNEGKTSFKDRKSQFEKEKQHKVKEKPNLRLAPISKENITKENSNERKTSHKPRIMASPSDYWHPALPPPVSDMEPVTRDSPNESDVKETHINEIVVNLNGSKSHGTLLKPSRVIQESVNHAKNRKLSTLASSDDSYSKTKINSRDTATINKQHHKRDGPKISASPLVDPQNDIPKISASPLGKYISSSSSTQNQQDRIKSRESVRREQIAQESSNLNSHWKDLQAAYITGKENKSPNKNSFRRGVDDSPNADVEKAVKQFEDASSDEPLQRSSDSPKYVDPPKPDTIIKSESQGYKNDRPVLMKPVLSKVKPYSGHANYENIDVPSDFHIPTTTVAYVAPVAPTVPQRSQRKFDIRNYKPSSTIERFRHEQMTRMNNKPPVSTQDSFLVSTEGIGRVLDHNMGERPGQSSRDQNYRPLQNVHIPERDNQIKPEKLVPDDTELKPDAKYPNINEFSRDIMVERSNSTTALADEKSLFDPGYGQLGKWSGLSEGLDSSQNFAELEKQAPSEPLQRQSSIAGSDDTMVYKTSDDDNDDEGSDDRYDTGREVKPQFENRLEKSQSDPSITNDDVNDDAPQRPRSAKSQHDVTDYNFTSLKSRYESGYMSGPEDNATRSGGIQRTISGELSDIRKKFAHNGSFGEKLKERSGPDDNGIPPYKAPPEYNSQSYSKTTPDFSQISNSSALQYRFKKYQNINDFPPHPKYESSQNDHSTSSNDSQNELRQPRYSKVRPKVVRHLSYNTGSKQVSPSYSYAHVKPDQQPKDVKRRDIKPDGSAYDIYDTFNMSGPPYIRENTEPGTTVDSTQSPFDRKSNFYQSHNTYNPNFHPSSTMPQHRPYENHDAIQNHVRPYENFSAYHQNQVESDTPAQTQANPNSKIPTSPYISISENYHTVAVPKSSTKAQPHSNQIYHTHHNAARAASGPSESTPGMVSMATNNPDNIEGF
ncbi:unnamed protein product, partial [Owenia fusiformis]